MRTLLLTFLIALVGCTFVGNSPEERRHRKAIEQEEQTFNRQMYERRWAPAVEETEAYFSFTNRLVQRDVEPMDLEDLGKLFVDVYGASVSWRIVTTAYADYSAGAPLENATNLMWLEDQSARTRDTAWMIHYCDRWLVGR